MIKVHRIPTKIDSSFIAKALYSIFSTIVVPPEPMSTAAKFRARKAAHTIVWRRPPLHKKQGSGEIQIPNHFKRNSIRQRTYCLLRQMIALLFEQKHCVAKAISV